MSSFGQAKAEPRLDRSDPHAAQLRSMRLLDGVNFFIAAVQTGFGTFVTVHLVRSAWPPAAIGLALSIATLSTLASQMPAGALIDHVRDKRRPALFGIAGVGLAALLLGVTAKRSAVYLALATQGVSSALIGPAIAAISLALVGESGLSVRIGRNARYASIGSGIAAGIMGFAGSTLTPQTIFFIAAALALPALAALFLMPRADHATPASTAQPAVRTGLTRAGLKALFLDRRVAVFAVAVMLFFAASAAIGPGIAGAVTRRRPDLATLVVAATILLPQAIVAAISPWMGRQAEAIGRRPLLLLGWGLLPFQAAIFAIFPGPTALVSVYLLNAVCGAVFGVVMPVIAADLTRRSGGFNLLLGALGVAIALGGSLSTFFAGLSAAAFGRDATAFGLALVGVCAFLVIWRGMPETRPPVAP